MLTYNGKTLRYGAVGSGVWPSLHVAPPAPLVPPNTIRFTFTDTSFDPSIVLTQTYGTWSNVSPGVWDWYKDARWVNYYDNPFSGKLTSSVIGEGNMVTAYANAGPYNNMEYLFYGCTSLTSATVVNEGEGSYGSERYHMRDMFHGCTSLETVSFYGFDFTYAAHDAFEYLFYGCTSLTHGPNLSHTGGITSVDSMYYGCSGMESVELFDTSGVTNFNNMLCRCSSLTEAPLFNTSKATSIFGMLCYCSSVTELPRFDTSNVVDFQGAFAVTAITSSPVYDTSKALYVDSMYQECHSLEALPSIDLSKVVSAGQFAYHCDSITEVPLYDMPAVTNVWYMFGFCENVESGALALYESLSSHITPTEEHGNHCFDRCGYGTASGYAELEQIPTSWGGLLVT